jgi:hypothetical protein
VHKKGRTISGDTHWSLKCGPILSHTLNAIKGLDPDWTPFIGVDLDAKVVWLKELAKPAELSRSDRETLDSVVETFGHLPWEELVQYTHRLPEWKKPEGQVKRRRIYLEDIARAVGHTDDRIRAIVEGDREKAVVRGFLSQFKAPTKAHA